MAEKTLVSYIGAGSNLGARESYINRAVEYLSSNSRIKVDKVSSLFETEPKGGPPQGKFLNCAVKIETSLSPSNLLKFLQETEKNLGRVRTVKNGPRTIDLDILLYGKEKIDYPDLRIPHPEMFNRLFVLIPLLEIEPEIFDKLDILSPYKEKSLKLLAR